VRHLILILREEGDPMNNYPANLGLSKMKTGITRKAKVTEKSNAPGQHPVIVSHNGQNEYKSLSDLESERCALIRRKSHPNNSRKSPSSMKTTMKNFEVEEQSR
jgi:hypothetical protein